MAVAVEVRPEGRDGEGRVFRLSRLVADLSLLLVRPAPFEAGQPVTAIFRLPELESSSETLSLRATVTLTDSDGDGTHGGAELTFVDPPREARQAIVRYVAGRLGLPGL